jgi:flagellar basal body-associated protein FliL
MAPPTSSPGDSGMIVLIIAIVMVCLALGGSYWFFVVNKPTATVSVVPSAISAEFTITGYTNPVYIMIKSGTMITHASYLPSGKYNPSALSPTTSYKYYVLTENMDVLLASGTFTTNQTGTSQSPAPAPSTIAPSAPEAIAPSPSTIAPEVTSLGPAMSPSASALSMAPA